jgi:thiamine biosynthesis protein ThiC
MARQDINQLEEEMHRANQAEIARRKKAMLEMDERGQLSRDEINHRLQGNTLQDPYGARKVAKQITEREMVNHPDHYQGSGGMEVIDIIENYDLGFSLGNAIKYILRSNKKGSANQDLKKAIWYIQREISNLVEEEDCEDL